MEAILLKKRKKLLKNEKNKESKKILDKVFDFADQNTQDPMALSASLLVVAKSIYLKSDLVYFFRFLKTFFFFLTM